MNALAPEPVFALLDDRNATEARPSSRLYEGYSHECRCTDPATLDATWRAVEEDLRAGLHAVLLADYEWGTKVLGAGVRAGSEAAALRVLLFRELRFLSSDAVLRWLAEHEGAEAPGPAGALDVRASVDRAEFHAAIHAIQEAIRAGETYQVNYTYRLDFAAHGSPLAFYRRLRARQPVPYGALVLGQPAQHGVAGEKAQLAEQQHAQRGGLAAGAHAGAEQLGAPLVVAQQHRVQAAAQVLLDGAPGGIEPRRVGAAALVRVALVEPAGRPRLGRVAVVEQREDRLGGEGVHGGAARAGMRRREGRTEPVSSSRPCRA